MVVREISGGGLLLLFVNVWIIDFQYDLLHNKCVIIISAPPSIWWWCHTRAPSGLSGDTSISGWGLSRSQLIMVQWECLLTWLPTCQCVCVHGYVYVGDETDGVCGLNSVVYQSVSYIYCSIFMPFYLIKLLNVYGAYIFLSAVCSVCFIIKEIFDTVSLGVCCVLVCVSAQTSSQPAQACNGFGAERCCDNNETPQRWLSHTWDLSLVDSTDESMQLFCVPHRFVSWRMAAGCQLSFSTSVGCQLQLALFSLV